jgi:hypothetical protein
MPIKNVSEAALVYEALLVLLAEGGCYCSGRGKKKVTCGWCHGIELVDRIDHPWKYRTAPRVPDLVQRIKAIKARGKKSN